uniref:DUF834 domain-containing protein n=1 Tax=Oryza rufipogon TaxID=4529 RepID=A0A0E0PK48_ORYRU
MGAAVAGEPRGTLMQTKGTRRKRRQRRCLPTLTQRRTATEDGRRRDRDGGEILSMVATVFLATFGDNGGVDGLRLGAAMPTTASG